MAALKGSIDFGLVHIPVEIITAEDRSDHVSFHMFDSKDKSRIRLKRVNENTGKEVDWDEIIKGYEVDKDKYVFFTEEELDALEEESNRSLAIDVFVDKSEIPPQLFETPYYIVPGKGGEKGYAILTEVLQSTEKYAVVQVTIRTREKIGAIYAQDGGLILGILRYPQELKDMSEVLPVAVNRVKTSKKEVEMAEKLMEQMSGRFNPASYKDEYVKKIQSAVKSKLKNKRAKLVASKAKRKDSKTVDIMDLLSSSLKKSSKKTTPQKKRA